MGCFSGTLDSVNPTAAPIRGARSCTTPKFIAETSTATPSKTPPITSSTSNASKAPAHTSPKSSGCTPPLKPKDKGKQPAEDHTRQRQRFDEEGGLVLNVQQGSVMVDTRRKARRKYMSFNTVIDFRGEL